MSWFKRLLTPEIEEREPSSPGVNPLVIGGVMAVAGTELAGEDASVTDVAMFVAYPLIIAAAGNAGAAAGAKQAPLFVPSEWDEEG